MLSKRTKPITPNTKISDDVLIEECIAEGYSSLVYRASRGNSTVIVKEFFPDDISGFVERGNDGISLICTGDSVVEGLLRLTRKLRDRELNVAKEINSTSSSNSMFSFSAEALDRICTENTIASYLTMETKAGITLQEYISLNDYIEIDDVFRILHYICEGVRVQLSKGYFNTDLKPENLWLFTERPVHDGTLVVPLDYGGCIKKHTSHQVICSSEEWEAPETHFFASDAAEHINHSFEAYLSQGTVLYSIAAIAFRMLMGDDLFEGLWNDYIHFETSTKTRNRMIRRSLGWTLEKSQPWMISMVYRFLTKALYFDTDPNETKLNRYRDIEEMDRDIVSIIEASEARGITPQAFHSFLLSEQYHSRIIGSGAALGRNSRTVSSEEYKVGCIPG